jgi:hypothetical protein
MIHAAPSLLSLSAIPSLVTLAKLQTSIMGPAKCVVAGLGCPSPLPVVALGASRQTLHRLILWERGEQKKPRVSTYSLGSFQRGQKGTVPFLAGKG